MEVEDAQESEYPTYLVRDPDEAVLIVHSSIEFMSFETNNGGIRQENPNPGEYILHLRPGTHIMRFKAEGYMTEQRRLVIAKKTYKEVNVRPSGINAEKVKLGTIEFEMEPGPVLVVQDNIQIGEFNVGASGLFSMELPAGPHTIKLIRFGSDFYQTEIEVEIGKTYQEIVNFVGGEESELISPLENGVLVVKSNPSDATVYVDGAKAGTSTLQVREISAGNHQIRIEKIMYQSMIKQVNIKANAVTTIDEILVPDFGQLAVNSDPTNAEVLIDGKIVGKTPHRIDMISSGTHSVVLKKTGYHDVIWDYDVKPGDQIDTTITLPPAFGSLFIVTDPSGASVYLDHKYIGQTPLRRDTVFSGQYILKIEIELYVTHEATITVMDGKEAVIEISLDKDFGTLVVSSNPAGIDVQFKDQGLTIGKTPIRRNLKPGIYIVVLADDEYETFTEIVNLRIGDSIEVAAGNLVRKTGILKLFTDPINADLYIDGELIGKSPQVINYPTGTYMIEARLEGYASDSKTVFMKHNSTDEIDFTLIKGGTLELSVSPRGADIFVDGEKVTSNIVRQLNEGIHSIKASADGFQSRWIEVVIKSGVTERVSISLQRLGGDIMVNSSSGRATSFPAGTTVRIDGVTIQGFQARNISPGSHRVTISAPGYHTKEMNVSLKSGESKEIKVKLSKIKTGPSGFRLAKQFLNGGMFHLGYQDLEFTNSNYHNNVNTGLIEEVPGITGGYRGTYLPLLFNLSGFYEIYNVVNLSVEKSRVEHVGGSFSTLLNLLPVNKFVAPVAGAGYQFSELRDNANASILKTSAFFWAVGGYINIPLKEGRKTMVNRIVLGGEFWQSIGAKEREWKQLHIYIGVGGPMWDKEK